MSENNVYIPSHALDSFAHALYAERLPEIGTRNPVFMVGIDINKSKPQYSNATLKAIHFIRGEEKNKAFEVKTKPKTIQAALQQLKEYARKPFGGNRELVTFEIKGPKIVNGKMSQERITPGTFVVGRTEKGPFISVVHWNDRYPHIAFYPGLYEEDSVINPSDDPERAYNYVCASALGWVETTSKLLTSEYARLQNKAFDQIRAQQGTDGGGQGGGAPSSGGSYGGNNNNNNNNYASQQTVTRTESSGDNFNF